MECERGQRGSGWSGCLSCADRLFRPLGRNHVLGFRRLPRKSTPKIEIYFFPVFEGLFPRKVRTTRSDAWPNLESTRLERPFSRFLQTDLGNLSSKQLFSGFQTTQTGCPQDRSLHFEERCLAQRGKPIWRDPERLSPRQSDVWALLAGEMCGAPPRQKYAL